MIEQIGEFLIAQGSIGVLALCGVISTVVLWRAQSRREKKHDSDRNEWHKESSKMSNEFLKVLSKLENGQERLYSLYNDLAKK